MIVSLDQSYLVVVVVVVHVFFHVVHVVFHFVPFVVQNIHVVFDGVGVIASTSHKSNEDEKEEGEKARGLHDVGFLVSLRAQMKL